MRKILIASTAAAALAVGLGAASAAEPGEEAYFHERGNLNAALAERGPAPSTDGMYQYGYQQPARGYAPGPLGFAPFDDDEYDD
jgi:hypothetical protein